MKRLLLLLTLAVAFTACGNNSNKAKGDPNSPVAQYISLLQEVPVEGAVIVTTPQDVALADVEKGVDMFKNKNIDRKIFGLVENMAWFTPEEHPDEKYYIFGREGGVRMAERFEIPLLGQIPLVQSIREGGDDGEPAALGSRPDSLAFLDLAGKLAEQIG